MGRTLSGKTTFAKKKAHSLQKAGYKTLVLDPFLDPEWKADFITTDPTAFLQAVWESRQCALFIDEGGQMIGKYDTIMEELATKGRHWGHKCFFISQRSKQLSTTLRAQCSELAIFKQSLKDTKDLADEYVEPMINEAHSLEKGGFIYVRDNVPPIKLNVFEL